MDQRKYLENKAIRNECKNLNTLINQLSNDLQDLRFQNAKMIEKSLKSSIDTNVSVPLFIPMIDWAHSRCALSILALQNYKKNYSEKNEFKLSEEDEKLVKELQEKKQKLINENTILKQELNILKHQSENEKQDLQNYFQNPPDPN